jgi:methionyl-tRNA formyltransferase
MLSGRTEATALSALLRQHNPQLTIRLIETQGDLDSLTSAELANARLIGFVTPVIVPKPVLGALGYGAYNFHPGPPHYPGWLPAHFAVYDKATRFGATAHKMVANVDAGPIVGVDLFDVPANAGVVELEQLAFKSTAQLFWWLAKALAIQCAPLAELPVEWSGRKSTRSMFAELCQIPIDITADELDRRIAGFGACPYSVYPTITIHGHRFRYVGPDADLMIESQSPSAIEPPTRLVA